MLLNYQHRNILIYVIFKRERETLYPPEMKSISGTDFKSAPNNLDWNLFTQIFFFV